MLTRAQLESVARLAIEEDLWVFADEVYAEVTFGAPHVSLASLPGMAERTITVQSFSKSFALAGARVGAVIGPEAVIAAARRVGVHTVFNVPVAMQRAALGAIRTGSAWMAAAREEYRSARDEAARGLDGSGLRFSLAEGVRTCSSTSPTCSGTARSAWPSSARSITACCSRPETRSDSATSGVRASAYSAVPDRV